MLYRNKVIQKNIFSLCFSHEGGYFSIGKITTTHHLSKNISYVDLLNKDYGNYFITLSYIYVGDKKIFYNEQAFIDSGTTLTYFPNQQYNQIMEEFLEICKKNKKCGNLKKIKGLGYCTKIKSDDEIDKILKEGWSNITVVFDGKIFIWEPENYYFIYNTEANGLNICLGFDGDKRKNILLGTTFMHGYDIIFDKIHYRMGFVPADCNRILKIEEKENDDEKINDINKLDNNINQETDIESQGILEKENKTQKIQEEANNTQINIQIGNNDQKLKENNNNLSEINVGNNNNINNSKIIINSDKNQEHDKLKNYINQKKNIIDIKIDKINEKDKITDKNENIEKNIQKKINLTKINDVKISDSLKTNNNASNIKKPENKLNLKTNNKPKNIYNFINKFLIFFTFIIFIIFVIFNIILCRENYLYIQNKKMENNELEIANEDSNNHITLFNDSI